MATEASSNKALPLLTGGVIGALAWAGLNAWFGQPFIPTTADLPNVFPAPPPPTAAAAAAAAVPQAPKDPGEEVFTTVCAACHQANGQGLPGAFPPLVASDWVAQDHETPIRILIAGLSGPVKVKDAEFNSMMPPPPGLDDEKIAQVLTYVRSHFENKASEVTKAQVAEVRAGLAGRATPFTADELTKLRPASAGK